MEAIIFLIILAVAVTFLLRAAARKNHDQYLRTEVKLARQYQRDLQKKSHRSPELPALEIHYTNASFNDSIRVVDRIRVENNLLIAFCHLRGESRTFRLDRIKQAVDINTGEVVENIERFLANSDPSKRHAINHMKRD